MTVDDRLEIMELTGRYSFAADEGRAEDYAGVFTEDGEFVGRTGQPDEVHVAGRDKLVKFAQRVVDRRGAGGRLGQTRHHQSSTTFLSFAGDRATTRTYLLTTSTPRDGMPVLGLTSVYEDDLVKTPAGWRIVQRRTLPDVKGVLEVRRGQR